MLSFRAGDGSGDYMMNVVFDADLLSVRYAIDTDPRGHEMLIVRRRKQSFFMDDDGFLLTGEEAAKHIVRSLLNRLVASFVHCRRCLISAVAPSCS